MFLQPCQLRILGRILMTIIIISIPLRIRNTRILSPQKTCSLYGRNDRKAKIRGVQGLTLHFCVWITPKCKLTPRSPRISVDLGRVGLLFHFTPLPFPSLPFTHRFMRCHHKLSKTVTNCHKLPQTVTNCHPCHPAIPKMYIQPV